MKKVINIISLILISLTVFSCEDVINVDLETAPPKLVIDASIKWEKGTLGDGQIIKLTTTTDFYASSIPPATGAVVTVTNISLTTPVTFSFIENGTSGEYICTNFVPVIGNQYTLNVSYKGENYNSTAVFTASPIIEKTEQSLKPGIEGKDVYEIKFYYQDNGAENNYYLVGAKNKNIAYPEYGVQSDEFSQGNLMFAYYRDEKVAKGDLISFSVQGITEGYYNYMNKLLSIAGGDIANPFATAPATLRGNIVNTTNDDNYPLGYFQLSEIDSDVYTIQ